MASQFPEDPITPPPPTPPASPALQPHPASPNPLIERAKRIILEPKAEWPRIDTEPASVQGIVNGYVLPLAAIGPIAALIGGLVFGYGAFGIVYRPSLSILFITAVLSYVLAVLSIWVVGLAIDALAPTFGGTKNPVQAMKVAAYSATAGWLSGSFQLVPNLSFLGVLGIYGIYLLWIGLPLLMRVPAEKAAGYVIVTIVTSIIVFVVVGSLIGSLLGRAAGPGLGPMGRVTLTSAATPLIGIVRPNNTDYAAQPAGSLYSQATTIARR